MVWSITHRGISSAWKASSPWISQKEPCLLLGVVCSDQWWRRCWSNPGWHWSPLGWKLANPTKPLWASVFYRIGGREEPKCDTDKQKHTPCPCKLLWMLCACSLAFFTGSNQIHKHSYLPVHSLIYLWHWCGCHVHIQNGTGQTYAPSVMRAANYVQSNTWY